MYITKLKLVKILKHTFNNIQVGYSINLLTGTLKVTLERFRLKLDKEVASLSDRSREFHSFAAKLILVQWPCLLLAVVFLRLFLNWVLESCMEIMIKTKLTGTRKKVIN